MLLPCCRIYRTESDPLFPDHLRFTFESDCIKNKNCCFISYTDELNNSDDDRCLYMFNAQDIFPCLTRTEAAGPGPRATGPARIEALPALSAASGADDLAAAQIEIGARLYGYDTVLVDLSRLKGRTDADRPEADLAALAALCRRLGMALVPVRSIDRPLSPAS